MKLVFFATPEFAIPSLKALHESIHDVVAVVTIPDNKSGRGQNIIASPIKKAAKKLKYQIYQPYDLKDPNFMSIIKEIDADIFIVVAYRIIPMELISISKEGAINLHASLLPKYRGAAPIHHAILNGERETGVTTFRIEKKVDTGDILLQEHYKLNKNITTGEAHDSLASIGAKMIITTLKQLTADKLHILQQNHEIATLAPKISSKDCLIDWNKSSKVIHNKIRAFTPYPGAFTYFKKKRVKLFKARVKKNTHSSILQPGEIQYVNHALEVGTGNGIICIYEIQQQGKKILPVSQFVSGFPEIVGNIFE